MHFEGNHMQTVSWLQLLHIMLTNFIGSSYTSDFLAKNVTYIELYMSSVMGVVCVFLLRVWYIELPS